MMRCNERNFFSFCAFFLYPTSDFFHPFPPSSQRRYNRLISLMRSMPAALKVSGSAKLVTFASHTIFCAPLPVPHIGHGAALPTICFPTAPFLKLFGSRSCTKLAQEQLISLLKSR